MRRDGPRAVPAPVPMPKDHCLSPAMMSPVEPTGMAGLKPADGVAEVGFPAARQEMGVIGHQGKRVKLEREALGQLPGQPEEAVPVEVTAEEAVTDIGPAQDGVPRPGPVDP